MQTKIMKAKPSDIPRLLELLKEFNDFEKRIDRIASYRKGFEKSAEKQLRKAIASKDSLLLVAETERKIIGFCGARLDNWPEKFAKNRWIEIKELFVRKQFRRKGIATMLVREIERRFKGKANGFELFCLKGNSSALKAYKNLGYRDFAVFLLKEA